MHISSVIDAIKKAPSLPGVYFFKDDREQVVYIGKAKNLKKRLDQYLQRRGIDIKVDAIFQTSVSLDYTVTATELEALLLEARMIQSYQPLYNVLLKTGQPFVYITVTTGALPELKIVRNKKQQGVYFGPFLEKSAARSACDFLIKTLRLKICKIKIANGCLYYHMGVCSGSCREDFDKKSYLQRLELAKNALKYGHKKFLTDLRKQIDDYSAQHDFEKARDLHQYYQSFERVFGAIEKKSSNMNALDRKDVWIVMPESQQMFVFDERHGAFKKKRVFVITSTQPEELAEEVQEFFLSYYRLYEPPSIILVSMQFDVALSIVEKFLQAWHKKDFKISIIQPHDGHFAALMRLGVIHAQSEIEKQRSLPYALKKLLKVPREVHTIDCFDISHKQGTFMVGSCVRFKDGRPDKHYARRFHIKTVEGQDDYACLQEIVDRRYRDYKDIPDLIVIDGGKGQLSAVLDVLPGAEVVSLAKREETVFSPRFQEGKILDQKTYAAQVLIALRDYAHHFALSFHREIERKKFSD